MADCKGAQLFFGPWAIWPEPFDELLAQINGMDVDAVFAMDPGEAPTPRMVDGVAIVDISGPMTKHASSFRSIFGGTSYIETRQTLRDLKANDEVEGVLLQIDSPGGSVSGLHDLHDEIRAVAQVMPVHAYADDLAASAGYDLATAATRITANRSAIIGSLGTVTRLVDASERAKKIGVKTVPVASGRIKGAQFEDGVADDYLAEMQGLVNSLAAQFKTDVMRGRGMTQAQADQLFTGQVWVGDAALELGLIDGIGSLDDAIAGVRDAARGMGTSRARSANGGQAMAENTDVQPAERKPATHKELRSAFPNDAEFVLECLDRELTMEQANGERVKSLDKQNAELRKTIEAKDAELAGLKAELAEKEEALSAGVGATAVPDGDAGPDDVDGKADPIAAYNDAVDALKAQGHNHTDAVRIIARNNPDVIEAYEDAINARS